MCTWLFPTLPKAGDGRCAADHLLHWSTNQRCPDRPALVAAMEALFRDKCDIHSGKGRARHFISLQRDASAASACH